jgi:hypothetical protein
MMGRRDAFTIVYIGSVAGLLPPLHFTSPTLYQIPSSASRGGGHFRRPALLPVELLSQDQITIATSHHMRLHTCLAALTPLSLAGGRRWRIFSLVLSIWLVLRICAVVSE